MINAIEVYKIQKDIKELKEGIGESSGLGKDWGTHSGKEKTSIKFPANFEEQIGTDGYFYFMADGDETKEYLGKVLSTNGYNIDMQVYMINANNKDFSAATYPFVMKKTATQISNIETNNLAWFKIVNEGGNIGAIQTVLEEEVKSEVSQLASNTDALKNYIGVQSQLVINTDDNSIHIMDGVTPDGHKIESNKSFEKDFGTAPFTSNKFEVWNRESGYSESSNNWNNVMWSHNGYVYAWRMNGDIRRFNPVSKEDELYARTSINIPVNNLAVLIKDEIYFLYYGEDRNYAMKKYKFLDRENPSEEIITDNAGPVDSGGTLSCAFSYKDEYYVFIIHNSKTHIKKFDDASKKFVLVHSFDKYNRFIGSPVVVKDCVYFCCDRRQGLQKINIKTGILTPTVDMPFYAITLLTDGENEIYVCNNSRVPATYLIDEDRYLTDEETGLCAVTSRVNPTHEYVNGYIISYGPYDGTLYNHSVITVNSNRAPIEVSNMTVTTATISSYKGVPGQIAYNKDTCITHVMDGTTEGGYSLFPMKKITQAEYDAIATKHPNTLYIITD